MKNLRTPFQNSNLTRSVHETYKADHSFNLGISRGVSESPHPREGKDTLQRQISQLTTREMEILQLVAEGKANKEAASELCVSIKTVEKHRDNLMVKLGIRGTALLTHFAIAAGIIQVNPWLGWDGSRNREFNHAVR